MSKESKMTSRKTHQDILLTTRIGTGTSKMPQRRANITYVCVDVCVCVCVFFLRLDSPSGPRPPQCWGFEITLRHTTLGRTPLDEWSARRRHICLTTNNTHKRQTSILSAGFEPANPVNEKPKTHAPNRGATGICCLHMYTCIGALVVSGSQLNAASVTIFEALLPFTYLLTPWCRVFLEQLTALQLVKKFPASHRTRRFITALTSVRHLSLSWASPIQSISHLMKIHPNIINPSTPRSPQWSLSLRFPHQDPTHPLSSPIRATCPAHLILLDYSFQK